MQPGSATAARSTAHRRVRQADQRRTLPMRLGEVGRDASHGARWGEHQAGAGPARLPAHASVATLRPTHGGGWRRAVVGKACRQAGRTRTGKVRIERGGNSGEIIQPIFPVASTNNRPAWQRRPLLASRGRMRQRRKAVPGQSQPGQYCPKRASGIWEQRPVHDAGFGDVAGKSDSVRSCFESKHARRPLALRATKHRSGSLSRRPNAGQG